MSAAGGTGGTGARRVVLVPGVLALRPEYASLTDPVASLRAAVDAALAWAAEAGDAGAVVVGNGSATRTEKAPGYLDERAEGFDAWLRAALTAPDPAELAAVDAELAGQLWASTESFGHLAGLLEGARLVSVDYDDAPYGVQYWVMRWESPAAPAARATRPAPPA